MTTAVTEIMVGQVWRLYYHPGNMNNKRIHVLYYYSDDAIICRTWKRGKWWYYLENISFFDVGIESGHLRKVEK